MRGEKQKFVISIPVQKGSPPLAWGKATAFRNSLSPSGITPTCVGKSTLQNCTREKLWDHPHLRGEKAPSWTRPTCPPGSPPLAWGKGLTTGATGDTTGITPTCVGKRNSGTVERPGSGDHPHLRGEKAENGYTKISKTGSPPLAWGKGLRECEKVRDIGITPTCVGKRDSFIFLPPFAWDHPHLRGEKGAISSREIAERGSPPLAWGKDAKSSRHFKRSGITPTCVGKSRQQAVHTQRS